MDILKPNDSACRKIGVLALVGFLAIVFSGPLFALLSVALSLALVVGVFALIGFGIWALIRVLYQGQQLAREDLVALAKSVGHAAQRGVQKAGAVLQRPVRFAGQVAGGLLKLSSYVVGTLWSVAGGLVQVVGVTATGVAIGAVVGVITGLPSNELNVTVPMNAVVGGILATLVGASLVIMEKRARRSQMV